MQTALIWGSSGGIGAALVDRLRAEGWQVLGVARTPRAGEGFDQTYPAELTREADVAAAALWAAQQAESVQLWVFAAGAAAGQPLADMALADWDRIIGANLTAAHLALRSSLELVAPGGQLVFLGAYADKIMLPRLGAYAAAKAGLESYVRVLAKEQRGRRVTLVRVGAVDTPLWARLPFQLPRGAHTPEAIAEAIVRAYHAGHRGDLDL